jgi:lysyl-tRNA synthetase class 2
MSQYDSTFEENLYNLRREKLAQIAALGQQAYPNSFRFTHTLLPEISGVPALLPLGLDAAGEPKPAESFEAEHVTAAIAGRIVAIRLQGKAGFATLQQGGARLQIYVRKDDVGEQAFELYKLLDLGDHIGVTGHLMRTRTGELTLKAQTLTFLTKAMLPLPDKFSGLGDIELRYRRRYLDLFTDTGDFTEPGEAAGLSAPSAESADSGRDDKVKVATEIAGGEHTAPTDLSSRPEAASFAAAAERPAVETTTPIQTRPPARSVFVKRAAILRAIRQFFDTRGYLEVETPMLHTIAGGAAARTFGTHHNAEDMELTLRIAPELFLKRLVVGGFDRVYEINRNFRNEGIDRTHNPEFTMLEFYQAYANYRDLMDLTIELIEYVAMEVNGTTTTTFNLETIDLATRNWTKLSMREAIIKFWPKRSGPAPQHDELANLQSFKSFVEALETYFAQEHKRLGAEREEIHQTFVDLSEPSEMASSGTRAKIQKISDSMMTVGKKRWTLNGALNDYDGKVYATVFEVLAEEHLIQPTIIYDFPLAVSPLSKVKPDEPEWTERFEFYIGGFEVGNAFSELNDADDQLARFAAQVADKDPESMAAIDFDYVRALGYGLPPTAGEGIGIDRLTMILTGSRTIRDVILFPLMRPQKPVAEEGSDESAE